jgi:hypothetical protein
MPRREELFEREDTLDFDVAALGCLWSHLDAENTWVGWSGYSCRPSIALRYPAARAVFAIANRSLWTPADG